MKDISGNKSIMKFGIKCKRMIYKCKICGMECKLINSHFWKYHYKDKQQELWDSPNGAEDIHNKYFEVVTIPR